MFGERRKYFGCRRTHKWYGALAGNRDIEEKPVRRFGRRVEGNPLLHPGARIEVDLEVLRLPDGCCSAPLVQDELKTPRGTGERRMRQSADDFPLHLREQTFLNDRHDVDVTPAWYIVPKRKRSDEISGVKLGI
jgi:hypothetical protein